MKPLLLSLLAFSLAGSLAKADTLNYKYTWHIDGVVLPGDGIRLPSIELAFLAADDLSYGPSAIYDFHETTTNVIPLYLRESVSPSSPFYLSPFESSPASAWDSTRQQCVWPAISSGGSARPRPCGNRHRPDIRLFEYFRVSAALSGPRRIRTDDLLASAGHRARAERGQPAGARSGWDWGLALWRKKSERTIR